MSVKTKVSPGQQYGQLTVLKDSGQRKGGQIAWMCRCECGSDEVIVTSRNLTGGRTKSCGCLIRAVLRKRNAASAFHDLPAEIDELAARHGLEVSVADDNIGWKSRVIVFNRACGHPRRTNVTEFLNNPLACRRCNKRMPPERLSALLRPRGISLQHIEYSETTQTASFASCKCDVCGDEFKRTVGALASGNRGCPGCHNIQERYVRVILTENFGGAFQVRVRPEWMEGLELDGLNEEATVDGKAIAFEYNGRYWHRADQGELSKTERKRALCAKRGIILLVVWAPVDRPSMDELMAACQAAVYKAGIARKLRPPSDGAAVELAALVPLKIRTLLANFGHDAICYDQNPDRRGQVVSRCNLSGEVVSQAISSLTGLKGCRHCQAHASRAGERSSTASIAARKQWTKLRENKSLRSKDSITDEVVAFVRGNPMLTRTALTGEVARRFDVHVTESALQYARSGKTHRHLDELYPPVRKAASNYKVDHPAVRAAKAMRLEGLSFDKISDRLFELGHGTLSGRRFSAAQIRNFCLLLVDRNQTQN